MFILNSSTYLTFFPQYFAQTDIPMHKLGTPAWFKDILCLALDWTWALNFGVSLRHQQQLLCKLVYEVGKKVHENHKTLGSYLTNNYLYSDKWLSQNEKVLKSQSLKHKFKH